MLYDAQAQDATSVMQEDTRKYVYFIEEHVAICHKRVVIREQHPARSGGGGPGPGVAHIQN